MQDMGFQRKFHIKSMFIVQNKYIFGRFGGHMDTINISTQSGGLRMRLNLSKRANRGDEILLWPLDHRFFKFDLNLKMMPDDFFKI